MGKKGKKGKKGKHSLDDYPDEDDYDIDGPVKKQGEDQAPEASDQPQLSRKDKKKKKQQKKKQQKKQQVRDESSDDDDLEKRLAALGGKSESESEEEEEEDEKFSKPTFAAALEPEDDNASEEEEEDDDDDEPVSKNTKNAGFAALMMDGDDDEEEESEEEEEVPVVSKPSGFAALMDDQDEEEEESEEEEAPMAKPSGFAALTLLGGGSDSDESDSNEDSEEDTQTSSVPPITGKVLSTEDHPEADKLKVCEIDAGDGTYQIVTSAKNVKKGRRVALARPGCVLPGTGLKIEVTTMRGVRSEGMVCSAFDLGWDTEKSKKAAILPKKWKAGHDVPEEMPEELKEKEDGEVDLSVFASEKKKKKKKSKDKEKDGEEGEGDVDLSVFGEAKKKKKSKKDKSKSKDKAAAAAAAEEEELSVEKLSLEEPKEPEDTKPAAAAVEEMEVEEGGFDASAFAGKGSKKKNKKKNKKKKQEAKPADDDFDDIDAILAQLDGPAAKAEDKPAEPEPEPEPEPKPAEPEKVEEEGEKVLTANQKKKLKKKQKEAEKKAKLAAAGVDAEPKDKKKKGGKPVSAAVRKMQEELELRAKMEEEQKRLEEEQRKKEEEEEAKRLEEERIKEEKRRLKKEKEKAKKAQQKKEGKLLTGKAKEEAKRLAAMREQMLRQAGIVPDSDTGEKKKKVVYERKKKRPAPAAKVEEKVEEKKPEEEKAPAKVEEEEVVVEKPSEEEPVGDWDEVDWESKAEEKSSSTSRVDVQVADKEKDDDESEDYSDSEELDSDEELERRIEAAREKRHQRHQEALKNRSKDHLRSPICCILGHVDTGKTKLLDKIRGTNVQDGEAGGITQQIGATYIPGEEIVTRTKSLEENQVKQMNVPGLLVIDTPGHESFTNLRSRGSGLCDIAILVIDIMHGLEQQTIESLNMLKMRKTPFIIALNKVDRMYKWNGMPNGPFRKTLASQEDYVQEEFKRRYDEAVLALNEHGMNVALYWENPDIKSFVSIVPTSAITGEGIPDILNLLVELTQHMMVERLMHVEYLQCTVLEVKRIEGLGTTIDVILINGTLREGDTIVVCGLQGPIVTQVRALLTPHPMKEMRVKGSYLHHKEIEAAQGVKICANDLENALAGTPLLVLGPEDDEEDLKDEVVSDVQSILGQVDKSGEGVCVQASTLGSLEALLEFLKSPDVKIPVSGISIGPVHKKDIMRASIMLERKKEYAVILAFDVEVSREAREMAKDLGIKIFTADIIYHLFDQFTAYMKQVKEDRKKEVELDATFPCVLKILPNCIFNKKDPIVLGVEVLGGIAKVGSPLCVPTQDFIEIGRIASLEKNHKPVEKAFVGDAVAMKVNSTTALEASRMFGRHFDDTDELVSRISRHSIDLLKENYRDELTKEDWQLVLKLKHLFSIQ